MRDHHCGGHSNAVSDQSHRCSAKKARQTSVDFNVSNVAYRWPVLGDRQGDVRGYRAGSVRTSTLIYESRTGTILKNILKEDYRRILELLDDLCQSETWGIRIDRNPSK